MSGEESASKKPRLENKVSYVQNLVPVAGPSNEQPQPKIFKLNIDYFDEVFEYLSLKDLHAFGKTCKK